MRATRHPPARHHAPSPSQRPARRSRGPHPEPERLPRAPHPAGPAARVTPPAPPEAGAGRGTRLPRGTPAEPRRPPGVPARSPPGAPSVPSRPGCRRASPQHRARPRPHGADTGRQEPRSLRSGGRLRKKSASLGPDTAFWPALQGRQSDPKRCSRQENPHAPLRPPSQGRRG